MLLFWLIGIIFIFVIVVVIQWLELSLSPSYRLLLLVLPYCCCCRKIRLLPGITLYHIPNPTSFVFSNTTNPLKTLLHLKYPGPTIIKVPITLHKILPQRLLTQLQILNLLHLFNPINIGILDLLINL